MCILVLMSVHLCTCMGMWRVCVVKQTISSLWPENIQHANMQLVTRLAEVTVVTGA